MQRFLCRIVIIMTLVDYEVKDMWLLIMKFVCEYNQRLWKFHV